MWVYILNCHWAVNISNFDELFVDIVPINKEMDGYDLVGRKDGKDTSICRFGSELQANNVLREIMAAASLDKKTYYIA